MSILNSSRRAEYASYSDSDLQKMYAQNDDAYKDMMRLYDNGEVSDCDVEAIERIGFALDDELCARGF